MPKYRKKPIVVDAVQFTDPEHLPEGVYLDPDLVYGVSWLIETLEGTMRVNLKDWIITGVTGEKYACKPEIFNQTYERTWSTT